MILLALLLGNDVACAFVEKRYCLCFWWETISFVAVVVEILLTANLPTDLTDRFIPKVPPFPGVRRCADGRRGEGGGVIELTPWLGYTGASGLLSLVRWVANAFSRCFGAQV